MKKVLGILGVLFFSVTVFGMQDNFYKESSFFETKDTDLYGYYWVDTLLTHNWVDITTIGTEVTGLSDDNNAGPFDIGFNFPYYWYQVDHFWVNSNGAISFSSAEIYFPQNTGGNTIPNTVAPNDLIVPLGGDLSFETGSGATCYYYTNNLDTLIVSFINVPAWGRTALIGSHTFQLLLIKSDSTIIFQYGKQVEGFTSNESCAGIENGIGNVGLQYFKETIPDSGEIVKFIPPDSTTYQVTDVGLSDAFSEGSKGIFLSPGEVDTPFVTVTNCGNTNVGSFDIYCTITNATGDTVFYVDTQTVASLSSGASSIVNFDEWSSTTEATYATTVTSNLAGDMASFNNTIIVELSIANYPTWLRYDNNPDSVSQSLWATSGSGWAQEFEPPTYPMMIDTILIAAVTTDEVKLPVLIMDDDGPGGGPGTILYADTLDLYPSDFAWYPVTPPAMDTITEGKFYIGLFQLGDSFPSIANDLSLPYSRRAWEFTSSWAPSRNKEGLDYMIRVFANYPHAVEEQESNELFGFNLYQITPNPIVNNKALIRFSLPKAKDVSLTIYNVSGQLVKTLLDNPMETGMNSITWDTKDSDGKLVPGGIYFYKLKVGKEEKTNKVILLK